jgi:tRNA(fMet)-specific endonuclease VapC
VGTLIDASVLVAAERGQVDPARLRREDDDERVFMSAITASELLHGVHRQSGMRRLRAERSAARWIASVPTVPFDLEAARLHAHLSAELRSSGTMVGAHDLIIAATALSLDCRVATRDLRSFPKIPSLDVVRW